MNCKIIAEAGVNHNGSLETAFRLVDAAKEAGADVVKFQTFKTENLVTKSAHRANYQDRNLKNTGSQFEMLKKLELTHEDHFKLFQHCKKQGIAFLSTPFDSDSLNFLVSEHLIDHIKIPSGEITNLPFLLEMARKGMPIILSTGMATLTDIEKALATLSFGLLHPNSPPSLNAFWKTYWSQEARETLKEKVIILHCTTEYPALANTINLRAMNTLGSAFSLPVGFSDHSQGIHIPIAAAALGAVVIEKHFTLDKSLPGPDHAASLEPADLKKMIQAIREVQLALGDGCKVPAPAEIENRKVARKVLIASRNISKGEIFSNKNVQIKRSGAGLSPEHYWSILGQSASQDFPEGDPLGLPGCEP